MWCYINTCVYLSWLSEHLMQPSSNFRWGISVALLLSVREAHETPEWSPNFQHKLPKLRQEARWGTAHCKTRATPHHTHTHTEYEWLEGAERSNPHLADWPISCQWSYYRGTEMQGSFHRGRRWFLSSMMFTSCATAISHVEKIYLCGSREGERKEHTTKRWFKNNKKTNRDNNITIVTTNNTHQSTLLENLYLLLWKIWWWGILGHQTLGLGPSPLWRPPLPVGLQNLLPLAWQQPLHTGEPGRCSDHTMGHLRGVSKDINVVPRQHLSICGRANFPFCTFHRVKRLISD